MTITRDPNPPPGPSHTPETHTTIRRAGEDWPTPALPLSAEEKHALAEIPPASKASQHLLGALVTRLSAADPEQRWAIGTWRADPLRRGSHRSNAQDRTSRYLWGRNNDWELRWAGYPFPADLVSSLTEPFIGLNGAATSGHDPTYDLTLDSATLRIRPPD